ncbi:MAG: Hsp20/alpha crystallin family protein [Phycisphaeraceae bacterium]|nr:Hsp20/alpha crystallin family protein [Phycisphaeraceae bacterium]
MTLLTRTQRPEASTFWRHDLDDLFSGFLANTCSRSTAKTWPSVDIINKDVQIEVRVEVPGCKPDDINITVESDVLTISGEKQQTQETKEDALYYRESVSGSFRRDIRLPAEVDANKIEASYEQGILNLVCPKSDKAKAFKVKIQG